MMSPFVQYGRDQAGEHVRCVVCEATRWWAAGTPRPAVRAALEAFIQAHQHPEA